MSRTVKAGKGHLRLTGNKDKRNKIPPDKVLFGPWKLEIPVPNIVVEAPNTAVTLIDK